MQNFASILEQCKQQDIKSIDLLLSSIKKYIKKNKKTDSHEVK